MKTWGEARIINCELIKSGTKRCSRCQTTKPITEFYKKYGSRKAPRSEGYYVAKCKSCYTEIAKEKWSTQKEYLKAKNKERYNLPESKIKRIERSKKLHHKLLTMLSHYFQSHSCVDCGESDILVLQFDHKEPTSKNHNIAHLLCKNARWDRILAEIAKCDVRCANCHQRRTAKQRNWLKLSV